MKIIILVTIVIIVSLLLMGGILVWRYLERPLPTLALPTLGAGSAIVSITTDKTEYEQGEVVRITVINNSDKSIWYLGSLPFRWWGLGEYKNGVWEEVNIPEPWGEGETGECFLIMYELLSIEDQLMELEANSEMFDDWDFRYCDIDYDKGLSEPGEIKFIEPGTYRFFFLYAQNREFYLTENLKIEELKIAYSNEFKIGLK